MSKIKTPQSLSNIKSLEDLVRYVSRTTDQVTSLLNGRINLADNASTEILSVTFPGANVNVSISHGLGRTPSGYTVVGRDSVINVYNGSEPNTDSVLNLRSSGAGTAQIMIF